MRCIIISNLSDCKCGTTVDDFDKLEEASAGRVSKNKLVAIENYFQLDGRIMLTILGWLVKIGFMDNKKLMERVYLMEGKLGKTKIDKLEKHIEYIEHMSICSLLLSIAAFVLVVIAITIK